MYATKVSTKSQDFISMCRHLQIESYESGCTIFNQGDVADKFYMVLTGTVGIFVNIPGGDE
jgi:CRP-like cAMP-binding protein